jgi:hypothetical protein
MAAINLKLNTVVKAANGDALPILQPTGTRLNQTAAVASTAATALPAHGGVLRITATDYVWVRFGASGVGAAAADANSMLFAPGTEYMLVIPTDATHVRVLRFGSADAVITFEGCS